MPFPKYNAGIKSKVIASNTIDLRGVLSYWAKKKNQDGEIPMAHPAIL